MAERRRHPNLDDAYAGEPVRDAELDDLDALARRLADDGPIELVEPPPALLAAIEREALGAPEGVGRRARRRWLVVPVAAAAAVLAVIGVVVTRADDPAEQVVTLEPLPGSSARGTAALVDDGRAVELVLEGVTAPAGSHLELWLLDPDATTTVPLGALGPLDQERRYALPPDADLDRTPIVDISVEPDDGNPAHSGTSLARATLR